MIEALALIVLGQTGGVDMMTQSALVGALREVRSSAQFYESAAQQQRKTFPFADLARTERRHERLLLGLLKTYQVAVPEPPKPTPLPKTLTETLKIGVGLETHTVSEYSHFLGYVKPQDINDIFTIIKVTARDLHLPALQKKLGQEGSPKLTPTQVRQIRDKVNKGR